MTPEEQLELEITAAKVRIGVIVSTHSANSGHPGGSLSATDMLTYLYFREMNIRPSEPKWPGRDRFVLSKGHAAPALYSVLAQRGFFPVEELKGLRHLGSFLQGHPNMNEVPGVDMSTGSLGQGVSAAAGMAKSFKIQKTSQRVYTMLGDGELEEGEVWEAMMFSGHYQLDNLCVMIDNNNLQIDGPITEVMSAYPIDEKLKSFGFAVETIDGHDFNAIEMALEHARETKGRPYGIVMKTVKGKGVSFMENQVGWHGKAANDAETEQALDELNTHLKQLESQLSTLKEAK